MRALGASLALTLAACSVTPPPGWQEGGRALAVTPVRWVNGDVIVDVDQHGRVLVNGHHLFGIDRAGRLYDAYNEPVALLDEQGYVTGNDDEPLGWVGATETILPGDEHSWLMIEASGLLMRYDRADEARPFGMWLGCDGPTLQTCMLVSHVVGREIRAAERSRRPGMFIGVGVGVPLR
jgi:hypothetical protein